MIKPPTTYAEWSELIGIFKRKENDADIIAAMKQGTIDWQSGIAERFSKKLIDAVNARMNGASDKFQQDISRCAGNESGIVQALLALRKEMALLADVINLPALPEDNRRQYVSLVVEQANSMQSSLEDSAKSDRTGKMASIVRNHRVNDF